eukprot:scaffold30231_cov29-Attheya_sp.AAC.1
MEMRPTIKRNKQREGNRRFDSFRQSEKGNRGGRIRQIARGGSNESNVTHFHQKQPGENDAEARTRPTIERKKQREKEPGELIRRLAYFRTSQPTRTSGL